MSKYINRYYTLGKIFEEPVDYDLVKDFIEHYVKIAEREGKKPAEVLQALKNASMELNDALMTNCVKLQSELPSEISSIINTSDWVSVPEAAKIYGITDVTIRNYIKEGLKHEKRSARKTVVSMADMKRFITNPKPQK